MAYGNYRHRNRDEILNDAYDELYELLQVTRSKAKQEKIKKFMQFLADEGFEDTK